MTTVDCTCLIDALAAAGLIELKSQIWFDLKYQIPWTLIVLVGFDVSVYMIFSQWLGPTTISTFVGIELLTSMIGLAYGLILGSYIAEKKV